MKIVRSPLGNGDQIMYLHTDQILKDASGLEGKLMAIEGVQHISIDKYKIRVEKSLAFDTLVVIAAVEMIIRDWENTSQS